MIQDIAPKTIDIAYHDFAPRAEDPVFVFCGHEVLLKADGTVPAYGDLNGEHHCRYLMSIDEDRYFMLRLPEKTEFPGLAWENSIRLRKLQPMDRTLAAFTAQHLAQWVRDNRFCGRCGSQMEDVPGERKLRCPQCGYGIHPRINPAVIAAVTDGDRLLMSRYARGPVKRYVLVAGFVEIGETAEQTVAREVMEETGLKVKNIRYFGSQPWGCSSNLTLGYWAELDGADTITTDTTELADACWFSRAEVPVPNDDTSVTSAMIRAFAEGRDREKN